jgi:phytoene desaturase
MRIAVIGGGVAGLSASAYLAANGHDVVLYEKNATLGGRARQFSTPEGYVFDMGPSWYWMPDVFERFFGDFGYAVDDHYDLVRLDPAFMMVFGGKDNCAVPGNLEGMRGFFERLEQGSAVRLDRFMEDARRKYDLGMGRLVYQPSMSWREFADWQVLKDAFRLRVFRSFQRHVRRYFSDSRLIALMEFPVLFLGVRPRDTPSLYSLMNYGGLALGTWYPMGGFGKVIGAMTGLGRSLGVSYRCSSPVEKIVVLDGVARGVVIAGGFEKVDAVVACADYHHSETELLDGKWRSYPDDYWANRTLAPSALVYYVGISKRLPSLQHHTLFFDADLDAHARVIYDSPAWPANPLFYVSCPSRTDPVVAPPGHENLFFLMPLAPGLRDDEVTREAYFKKMVTRLENHIGTNISSYIDYKRSYCVSDFVRDYNSFRGNAYGLANTLRQTAILRPRVVSRKVRNLFFAGHLSVPGPGVPPALISGKIAAGELLKRC